MHYGWKYHSFTNICNTEFSFQYIWATLVLRRKHNFCFEKNGYNKKYNKQKTKKQKNLGKENSNPWKTGQSRLLNCKTCNNSRSRHHVACRFVNFWKVIPEYNECSNELDRTLLIVDEDSIENKKLTYYTPRQMSLTDVLSSLPHSIPCPTFNF